MLFKPTTNLNGLLHGLFLPLPVFCQVSVKVFLEQTSKAVSYWALQWSWFAPVNALCNLLCKKSWEVAAWLQGWFLSRHCFMLCITTEVEPKIAKQYKCHHCCSCKNYQGKGMKGKKKKCLGVIFWLTRRLRFRGKNVFWGILQHKQQVIVCCQTHFDYGPPKMPLKLAV